VDANIPGISRPRASRIQSSRLNPADGDRRKVPFFCEREHRKQDYAEGHTTRRQLPENVPSVPELSELSRHNA
jgi:hypothetical protein